MINLIISDSYYYIKQKLDDLCKNSSDIIKINYNNYETSEIISELSYTSLFDENKTVIIENAEDLFSKGFENDLFNEYFSNHDIVTKAIFITSKIDKTNKYYKYIKDKYNIFDSTVIKKYNNILEVKKYVKDHNSSITDKALNYLKESCLNDYDLMIREIDKLLILGKDNISDELVYNLVSLTPDGNNKRFIDALMDLDMKESLICVENMKMLNIDISKMLALIAWNVRVTYLIKKYRKDKSKLDLVLKQYKVQDYAYNNFVRRGNIRSEEEFENLLVELANIDTDLKNFKLDRKNLGYYLATIFCN